MFYQLRRYVPAVGKAEVLHARFRDHVLQFMKKAGVDVIGFWQEAGGNLTYLVRFTDKGEAALAWERFSESPDWKRVKTASEVNGPLTASIESIDLDPVSYFEGLLQ